MTPTDHRHITQAAWWLALGIPGAVLGMALIAVSGYYGLQSDLHDHRGVPFGWAGWIILGLSLLALVPGVLELAYRLMAGTSRHRLDDHDDESRDGDEG